MNITFDFTGRNVAVTGATQGIGHAVARASADKLAALTSAIPQGRFAEPSEIAAVVAFLAAEEAGYITGAMLAVDGGMSM